MPFYPHAEWDPNDRKITSAEGLLYCLIMVLPFEQFATISNFSISKWVGLLFFVWSGLNWRLFYSKRSPYLYAMLICLSIGMADDFLGNLAYVPFFANEFIRPFLFWLLMLVSYNLAIKNRIGRIILVIFLSSLLFAALECLNIGSEYTRVIEDSAEGETGERIAVWGSDPNFAAVYMALALVYGIARGFNVIRTAGLQRVLYLLGSCVSFIAILKTGSRGGLLALGGGLLSLSFTPKLVMKRLQILCLILFIGAGMGIIIMHNDFLQARINSTIETTDTSGRLPVWDAAWAFGKRSPLLGGGLYMHIFEFGTYVGKLKQATHNTYLAIWLGSGVIGLVFFLICYLRSMGQAWFWRKEKFGGIIFVWMITLFIGSMSLNMEISKVFWIVMALGLALAHLYPKRPMQM